MKHKLLTKILATSAFVATGGAILPTVTSCKQPKNYDNLFFTINNGVGLEVTFCNRGASIYSMKYKNQSLTYHPKDKATFVNPSSAPYFHGKTLGRVAGRFEDGILRLNGRDYPLQKNEVNNPKTGKYHNNCLHGGYDSFCFRDFKRYVSQNDDSYFIAFNYLSPAMEAGFPEAVDAWVIYTISKSQPIMDTTLYAIPSGETVIDMSTHPLFRLGNSGDIKNHELTIGTQYMATYDDHGGQVPYDGDKDVKVAEGGKTPWDFTTAKLIGQDIEAAAQIDEISNGYDHIWYFKNPSNFYVKLTNKDEGMKNLSLTVTRNASEDRIVAQDKQKTNGVICYSNCYPKTNWTMQDGSKDTLYAGITIEPYTFFTKSDISSIIYTPENPFYRSFRYTISQDE